VFYLYTEERDGGHALLVVDNVRQRDEIILTVVPVPSLK
jgi:hypothetical protein